MQAKAINALITTAIVLGTIYVLNLTPARPFVQKALGN